jgi:hypothetical protein
MIVTDNYDTDDIMKALCHCDICHYSLLIHDDRKVKYPHMYSNSINTAYFCYVGMIRRTTTIITST